MSIPSDAAPASAPAPLGEPVPNWRPPARPSRHEMTGRWTRLEPLDAAAHADALFDAFSADPDGGLWRYMPMGPFPDRAAYRAWAEIAAASADPLYFALRPTGEAAAGHASYLRIAPESGAIEIGSICLAPSLQRTRAGGEAIFLMMQAAFELGYRRLEWKCDALNAPSRRAALRYGFVFEGVFRQATVVKGRNRDTAWFSMLDKEWPRIREAHERWLAPENFDDAGRQRESLGALIAAAREEQSRGARKDP